MELRILKYFVAVVEEESITKAAEILHTTQPNLSRQLHSLEQEVGNKLLERGSRKITLTEEGLFLYKRAKEIIDLSNRTKADLSSFGKSASGNVYIGAAETHIMRLIGDSIVNLRKKYPNIQYHIFSGSTIEVTEQLNKGLLDYAILVGPVDLQKYNYLKLPINDAWGVLMRKDSPLANHNTIKPEDIKDKPIFLAKQQLDSNILSGWLKEDTKNLNIVGTFNLITTPAMMIESGIGYLFTFDKLINTSGDSKLCFIPLEPKLETELYLVWKKNQIFSKPAKLFLDNLQQDLFSNTH